MPPRPPLARRSLYQFGDGVAQGSRWGLRGAEDLGGGLKAIFKLENGFNIGNGALGKSGAEFGRQAYVGLTQNGVGSLTLGRQYSFSTDYLGGSYANGGQTVAGNSATNQRYRPAHVEPYQQLDQVQQRELLRLDVRRDVRLLEPGWRVCGRTGLCRFVGCIQLRPELRERPARHRRSVHGHPLPGFGIAVVPDDAGKRVGARRARAWRKIWLRPALAPSTRSDRLRCGLCGRTRISSRSSAT